MGRRRRGWGHHFGESFVHATFLPIEGGGEGGRKGGRAPYF